MTIIECYKNLCSTPKPDIIARNIVLENGDVIVELVKTQMMYGNRGGVRKEVARLGWYKPNKEGEPSHYAIEKNKMNSLPGLGIVDLKLTGDFYNAFYFDNNELEVNSSDSKTEKLTERYGKYIFKLTPDSIDEFRGRFNWQFYDTFRGYLQR